MDSDNILSILNSLGQGQPQAPQPPVDPYYSGNAPPGADAPDVQLPGVANNVLQQMPGAPQQAVLPPQAPPTSSADIYQAATAASPPTPKPRASLRDILGHLADGIAQAGGATPMYQKTLDAMQAHDFAAQKLPLEVQAAALKNATDKFALDTSERTRFANVLGAITDPQDAANMPQLMAAAGLTDPRYAPFVKIVQANPDQAKVLASALGGGADDKEKYLGVTQVIRNKATGEIQVLQPSADGSPARNLIPPGWEYVDTYKPVDLGGTTGMTGAHSPTPSLILPHSVKPDTVTNNATSRANNQATNQTNLMIAGMPARAKDGGAGSKASDPQAGLQIISDIQQSFDKLHGLNALPGEGGAVGNFVGAIGRTSIGQAIEAKTGLSAAAQEREILAKNLSNLQSDLIKSLPGNATRTRFEQEIQKKRLPDPNTMNYATANRAIAQIRQAYTTALKSQPAPSVGNSSPPMLSPADAAKLPSGTSFRTLDGRILVRH